MITGTVTGQSIESYRGSLPVRLLKVQLLGNFPERIEWFDVTGEDTAPLPGDKVVVWQIAENYKIAVATKDLITAAVDAGERKFYSRDSGGNIKSVIYLKNDGTIELNDADDSAVLFSKLDAKLQILVTAINAAFATKQDSTGAPGTLSLDLSTAESQTLKIS